MNLADLIDLEARVAADARDDADALRARDRGIAATLDVQGKDRDALLSAWVRTLRAADGPEPSVGQRLVSAYRLLGLGLVVAGLGFGWSLARAVLAYDGGEPVNVLGFLLVFVAAQVLLLALIAITLPLSARWPQLGRRVPVLGDLRGALARLASWLAARLSGLGAARVDAARRDAWAAALARLRSRASLYRPVERWVLVGLTQSFGVAFNVGALLGCLQLVLTSDLAFAWATTLQVEATSFHGAVRALAGPWAAIAPDAVPSLELVEVTRWSRLSGTYVGAPAGSRAVDPAAVGGWWPFLLAALVAWGLLPRVVLLGLAAFLRRRALGRLPLDTADVDRVVRRLRAPGVDMRSLAADAPPPEEPTTPLADTATHPSPGTDLPVVLWRDMPRDDEALARALRATWSAGAATVVTAGGLDFDADRAALRRAAETAPTAPVVVVAEAWEAPDKAVLRLLRDLREAAGERRLLVVGLLQRGADGTWRPPDPEDLAVWKDRLATLGDPWLGVEVLA